MTGRIPPDGIVGDWNRLTAPALAALLVFAWLAVVAAGPAKSPGGLPSITTLSASGNLEGAQFTVLAAVAGSGPNPTGTVTFSYTRPSPVVTTLPLDPSGRASLTQHGLCCGEIITYHAAYSGDAHYAPSTAAPLTVAFHPPFVFETTTSLVASPTTVFFGEAVRLTATTQSLGGGNICGGGTTEFLDGGRPLSTVRVDESGVGILSVTTFAVGTHQVTAQFTGGLCTQPGGVSPLNSTSAPVTVSVTAPGLPATGQPPPTGARDSLPIAGPLVALLALAVASLGARRRGAGTARPGPGQADKPPTRFPSG